MKISKRNIHSISFCIVMMCVLFSVQMQRVEAKSIAWNTMINQAFAYMWNWGNGSVYNSNTSGWALALKNPNISITYLATVTDSTGSIVNDLANVPVGTILNFTPTPFQPTHISWFGTGYSADSPYGTWISGAQYPGNNKICTSANFVGTNIFSIYIPLSVNPPTVTITHAGSTAGLTCNSTGSQCTVTSAGTINTQFTFGNTYGKFYYGYTGYSGSNQCATNSVSLRKTNFNECVYFFDFIIYCPPDPSDYIITVPQQTISFTQTALATNAPPSPPTISDPTIGQPNTPYTFTVNATDPDGDTLRYGFDWDNNGTVDYWTTPYVNSGTSQTGTRTWITEGSKTFKVLAQDMQGINSIWTTHIINITEPPVPGVCGTRTHNYPENSIDWWPGETLCSKGTAAPLDPVFPKVGESISWTCTQDTSVSCTVTRSNTTTVIKDENTNTDQDLKNKIIETRP